MKRQNRQRRKVDVDKLSLFIRDHLVFYGRAPTIQQMSDHLGQGHSTSVIRYALTRLERMGRIELGPKGTHRSVRLPEAGEHDEASD